MRQPRVHPTGSLRERGFNIVELMTVVAIMGVVAVLALPAMKDMIVSQRVKATSYDLNADMTYARSEAIGRGADVVVASASGTTNWLSGWTITTVNPADGSTVTLRPADARGADLTLTGPGPTVTFDRTGRGTAGATVQFSIVPVNTSAPDHQKRCLRLDPSGRVRTAMGACS